MIILFWLLNFGISWLNAWGCGTSWVETKKQGGFAHLVNWSAAIMSVCGFTWCYTILIAGVGSIVTTTGDDGVVRPFIDPETFEAIIALGYSVVILPVIGSGLVLTINSWINFIRKPSLLSGAEVGWNTYAQASNMINAVDGISTAGDILGKLFSGGDKDSWKTKLVLGVVIVALFGGVLTTWTILTRTAKKRLSSRVF